MAGVSIGAAWGPIWAADVWADPVWAGGSQWSNPISVYLSIDEADFIQVGTIGGETAGPVDSGPSRLDINMEGDRFQIRFVWNDPTVVIRGFSVFGHLKQRPSE